MKQVGTQRDATWEKEQEPFRRTGNSAQERVGEEAEGDMALLKNMLSSVPPPKNKDVRELAKAQAGKYSLDLTSTGRCILVNRATKYKRREDLTSRQRYLDDLSILRTLLLLSLGVNCCAVIRRSRSIHYLVNFPLKSKKQSPVITRRRLTYTHTKMMWNYARRFACHHPRPTEPPPLDCL